MWVVDAWALPAMRGKSLTSLYIKKSNLNVLALTDRLPYLPHAACHTSLVWPSSSTSPGCGLARSHGEHT